MNHHLNDEQIAEQVVEQNVTHEAHLRDCAECSARVAALQRSLGDYAAFARETGEQPNTYWWRQKTVAPARSFPVLRFALAAVLTFSVAATVPFLRTTNEVTNPPAAFKQMSDEALLSEVQNDVGREYPDALAPVETNAESAVAAQVAAKPQTKEVKK